MSLSRTTKKGFFQLEANQWEGSNIKYKVEHRKRKLAEKPLQLQRIFAYLHCIHLALHELLCMCKHVQTDTYKHAYMMNISKPLGQIQDEAYTQLRLESSIASRTKYSQKKN